MYRLDDQYHSHPYFARRLATLQFLHNSAVAHLEDELFNLPRLHSEHDCKTWIDLIKARLTKLEELNDLLARKRKLLRPDPTGDIMATSTLLSAVLDDLGKGWSPPTNFKCLETFVRTYS
jgi:hypothetical protein